MSKIHSFIEFLITVVLRCTANTRSVLNRFRIWRWLNEPMSESCAPIVRWWNAKAELANSDRNRYFMSARRRYGIFGYGLYTQYQPIILTDEYNTEIEELMKFRYKYESSFFMGGRLEVMAYIKGLRNSDFDNAITMDVFRAARFTAYIDAFCADTMNHQSLFRHWLSVQVRTGKLTEIDGYIFTGATKNCEIGAFLYKYFDTFETAHAVGLHQGYRSPEHLAQYLVKELQKAALGLTDGFEFECINTKLRDYTERNKASQIAVTDLGNGATLIEMVDAMIQAHIADRAKNILSEEDLIGVKPAKPWAGNDTLDAMLADFGTPSNKSDAEAIAHVQEISGVQHRRPPAVMHGPAEERLCDTFGVTVPITDLLQRMSNTTQSIASMPEAFRLHKGNVLKSSVSIELDDICSINNVLFTDDAFSDISKMLHFPNKRELRFYSTIRPGLSAVIKLKQSRKFLGAVFTVTDIVDVNDLNDDHASDYFAEAAARRDKMAIDALIQGAADIERSNDFTVNEFELVGFKERNVNSEGDVYVLGRDRILEIRNFQAVTVLAYGDVEVVNPTLTDLNEAGIFCLSEYTLTFHKASYMEYNYVILKVVGGAFWKHHSKSNAEVPSMCDRRVTDIKVNLGESVIHAELPAPLDNLSLMDSTLNITFTTKSLIALDKPFDFTDVLGIFLNGDEVDISKSTSIAESLKVAGITFTDNDRYLHYTPVTKHVDSMVLQLKKSSDVKQKTQAEFTVVAKLPPVIKEILDLPTTEVLHAPVCTIGEAEGIMAMGVVSPESLAANEALDPMSDLSTVIKLLDPLTENTIIDEVVNHDADPATLYPAWGISPLKSNSNEFIEEKFVNVGITSTEVVHDPLKAGLRLDVDNAINFTTPKTWVELIANVLSIRTDDSFYLSPSIMQLKNKGLVLSKDGLQLSFIKLAHCRHDAVIINLMSDKDNVKTSHESLVDIQSLTRSASVASGRLDAKELSR